MLWPDTPAREVLRSQLERQFSAPRDLARALLRQGRFTPYQVFKARHLDMHRVAALKLIRKKALVDQDAVGRFRREARGISQLSTRPVWFDGQPGLFQPCFLHGNS